MYVGDYGNNRIRRVSTGACISCETTSPSANTSVIPVFSHYTKGCEWECLDGYYRFDYAPSDMNVSNPPVLDHHTNYTSTCLPQEFVPSNNISSCFLNYTWDDLILNEFPTRNTDFKTGGLGRLMVKDNFEVWLCEKNHTCVNDSEDFFCFTYDERNGVFYPWGLMSELKIKGHRYLR